MKYPPVDDVTPIMDLADMLRRGVLDCGAHLGPPPKPQNRQRFIRAVDGKRAKHSPNPRPGNDSANGPPQPSWLLTNPILPVISASTLNQMSRKYVRRCVYC
jgi:hypothetical protein